MRSINWQSWILGKNKNLFLSAKMPLLKMNTNSYGNFATIDECLDWLEKKRHVRREMDLGLERVEQACQLLDSPEKRQKTIHITGTNGKGSTVAFLVSILKSSGLQVGSFTSPHLENWNERISINNSPISNKDFFTATFQILNKLEPKVQLTIFEFLTVVALYYFAEINPVDIVIYEVGLGGEHDATNIVLPLVSIISNIDYDHIRYLGSKLEEIAKEKAGIIKSNTPCFTAETRPRILALLRKESQKKRSKLVQVSGPKKFTFDNDKLTMNFQFKIKKENFNIKTKMLGPHQIKNICLAIEVAVFLKKKFPNITKYSIEKGIAETFWPNRLEIVSRDPLLIIDGAHNHAGAKALTKTIASLFPYEKTIFLVSIMKDKQVDKMLNAFKKVAYQVIFTEMPSLRRQEISKLSKNNTFKFRKIAGCQEAFNYFYSLLNKKTVGVISGSLLFTSHMKKLYFSNRNKNNLYSKLC